MKISRRSFLKSSASAGAAVAMSGGLAENVLAASPEMKPGPGNKWPGRVAINFNSSAVTMDGANATPNIAVIAGMVDKTIMLLTGESTVGAAWKAVFPSSLTATSKIAIKVNTLNPGLSAPHWSSVKAITDGLQKMDINGTAFPGANLTIYEGPGNNLDSTGFNETNFGTTIKIANDKSNLIAGGDGALNNRTYCKTLRDADFLINVFSPRGHMINTCSSTFTLGFKSHFGTYSSPMGLHGNGETSAAATNLRDINCTGPVYNKTVLSVCSGIFGNREGHGPTGGPDPYLEYAKKLDPTLTNEYQPPTTIMMSTDPVSIEMQTIKMMRMNKNPEGPFGKSDMPPYLRASGGITGALSGTTYNIGQIDGDKIEVKQSINENVIVEPHQASGAKSGTSIFAVPIKNHNSTFIQFKLPRSHVGRDAQLAIYDLKGSLVRRHSQKVLAVLNQFSWDNRDGSGKSVSLGTYIVRLTCGSVRLSSRFATQR
jgi:hypothetical protein